jgi:hypothetical protein
MKSWLGLVLFGSIACGDDSATGGTSAGSTGGMSAGGGGAGGSSSVGGSGASGGDQGGSATCDGKPPATDANGSTPKEATSPHPTLRNLSLVWDVDGDDDLDAVVRVRFRKQGGAWRLGLPLRRTPSGTNGAFNWPNRHAGSVFDLEPATTYDVELWLDDPDGGCEIRTLTATTRPIPGPMANAPVKAVTPATFAAMAASAQPGDILELAAGTYPTFSFNTDGTIDKPIVIRGVSGTVIDGDVRLDGRSYVHVTGLQIQGQIKWNGGVGLAMTRNTLEAVEDGIVTKTRGEDAYIADNVITGVTQWNEAAIGVDGNNIGEGIEVTGPGHVIEHNRVIGFRDAISLREDGGAIEQFSIDINDNDIDEAADDAVEADFCFHNCRIVRNRISNSFIGLSSQPGLGGPTYFIRNVQFNVILTPFKLQRGSIGDVAFHNTVVKSGDAFAIYTTDVFSRQLFRNNLFIGGPGGTFGVYDNGNGDVMNLAVADPSGDYDYDGYFSTNGAFSGQLGGATFESVAEMNAMTTEKHGVEVDLASFVTAPTVPTNPFPAKPQVDLRLSPGGKAVDKGVVLENVNDGFAGSAPDLGAHEAGDALPNYGPRP